MRLSDRRAPRATGTPAEAALWTRLNAQRLDGFRWRRQVGVGPYVLDFYCPEVRLAVELDGAAHGASAADAGRSVHLTMLGIRVVRFSNRTVFERAEAVLGVPAGASG